MISMQSITCSACEIEHGPLYVCPLYSKSMQRRIEKLQKKFRKDCLSGEARFSITTMTKDGRVTEVKSLNELFLESSQ